MAKNEIVLFYLFIGVCWISSLSSFPATNVTLQTENRTNQTNGTAVVGNQAAEEVSIIFAGDISMDKPIRKGNSSSCAYSELISNLTKYFQSVDYNLVNVEAPFVNREMAEHPAFPNKGIHNMVWEEAINALTTAGVKGATISNNHITDYGGQAAFNTKEILQRNGIEVIGLTNGTEPPYQRQVPLIKDMKGIRIAFLAYCGDTNGECKKYREGVSFGAALLDNYTVRADIEHINKLEPKVDHIVAFLHWGKEYMAIPNEEQREMAVELKKMGVGLIIGSHPHVMQGHEWINDTLVHYSLGNFVFHPHYTFMGGLSGKANKAAIHARAIKQSKLSRGPAGFTELFKVIFTKTEIKTAFYLPVRVHVDRKTFCLYPKALKENDWQEVCGPSDNNCYFPRPGSPIYKELEST